MVATLRVQRQWAAGTQGLCWHFTEAGKRKRAGPIPEALVLVRVGWEPAELAANEAGG